jgi:hypothetical protein
MKHKYQKFMIIVAAITVLGLGFMVYEKNNTKTDNYNYAPGSESCKRLGPPVKCLGSGKCSLITTDAKPAQCGIFENTNGK